MQLRFSVPRQLDENATVRLLGLLLILVLVAPAQADVPRPHDLVLGADLSLGLEHISSYDEDGYRSVVGVAPSIDGVVVRGLTLGGGLLFLHESAFGGSADEYGVHARVGYLAALGDSSFVWPRVGLAYLHSSAGPASVDLLDIQVDVLLGFVTGSHLMLGIGPFYRHDLAFNVAADHRGIAGGEIAVGGIF